MRCLTLALVALPLLAVPALAQSINQKICIFESARRLPSLPDARIAASSAKRIDKVQTVAKLAASGDLKSVAAKLGAADKLTAASSGMPTSYSLPDPAVALASAISESMAVDLDVMAAAQKATFSFTCLIGTNGAVHATFDGILR
ncbi:hypothetical protein [Bosea minatitlanensis]|uniref:Uncharacterized protein n=1 Tax=Bosea minatitlanensis TaxID=128782 RepID=A0ABW0F198_9HYPH|nr:hypothetical protein [Bosea minatitlanensis]MCT4492759.1 hypothetical protein [Bosea minatitlanensis]